VHDMKHNTIVKSEISF